MTMPLLTKPARLHAGDRVAAITLSWGGPGTFPYRYEVGKQRLEQLFNLQVQPTKHALASAAWIAENPPARAEDLMNAFRDPAIKGIISNIGGEDSIRMLPYIDLQVIRDNPKIFLGFSDSTVTHFLCFKAGLCSFYGPSIMTAFAENVAMHAYSIEGVRRSLFFNDPVGMVPENTEGWTNEFLDWAQETNQLIRRRLYAPCPWNFIGECTKVATGRLLGGCVEVLEHISGTDLWPTHSTWEGSILFLETSEHGIEPSAVLTFLRMLANRGVLERLHGILFSKPGGKDKTSACFREYDPVFLQVFDEYQLPLIPIVTQMDFGHTDPMWTLPYGALVEINPTEKCVKILESCVT